MVWVSTPDMGILTKMAPKPMGKSSAGSISFFTASQMSRPPMTYITTCCQVMERIPSVKKSIPLLHSFVFFPPYL